MTEAIKIAVIGVGRIGLPLLKVAAKLGHCIGIDSSASRVHVLERDREEIFGEQSPNVEITTMLGAVRECNLIIISIGVNLNEHRQPDITHLQTLIGDILYLKQETEENFEIVLRSTVSPGTSRLMFMGHTMSLGKGTLLYCPERIREGHFEEDFYNLPDVIGTRLGLLIEPRDKYKLEIFLGCVKSILPIFVTWEEAEIIKLFSNISRYIHFAVSTQLALLASRYGADGQKINELMSLNYPHAKLAKPGLSGGYCLAKDGFLLLNTHEETFLSAAYDFNENLPNSIVNLIVKECKSRGMNIFRTTVLLCGASFKADSDDLRYSPSLSIQKGLLSFGFEDVFIYDPHSHPTEPFNEHCDIYVIGTNHTTFYKPFFEEQFEKLKKPEALIFDAWDITAKWKNQKYVWRMGRDGF